MNKKPYLISMLTAVALSGFSAFVHADVVIGVAGPMTGQYAAVGDHIKRGVELAVKDINARGGVLGEKIRVEYGDDACDPKQAVSVANTMANKGIVFMHGHWCSSSTIPAAEVYEEAGIPMATVSTNPQVTEKGRTNLVRIMGRDDDQGKAIGDFLAKNYKDKKVAVVDDKTAYGKGLADEIAKALEANGMKPALRETINAGESDYSNLVTKMKAAGIDFMAFGGYHAEVALILRQARQAGYDLLVIGGDTMTNSDLYSAAGSAANNVFFTFSPDPRKNPESQAIVEEFRKNKFEPEGYVLYAYAALQLFEQAATQAKSFKYDALNKAIHEGSFKTVIGNLSFDAQGNLRGETFRVYRWKDGTYDYVN